MELNKIYCMDCVKGMKELVPDASINLVITSPPYNVGVDYDVHNDRQEWADYLSWCGEWLREVYRVLKPDGRIALNIPYEINMMERGGRVLLVSEYWQLMKQTGFKFAGIADLKEVRPQRVKLTAWGSWLSASAPYIYNPKECVLIAYKDRWKRDDEGRTEISKSDFQELVYGEWEYRAETGGKTKANFSLDIPMKALKILSYEGDVVLDPFMGSGTTAWACRQLNRNFIGFEISPSYVRVAKGRGSQVNLKGWL